jgi:hypothetical protein
MLSAAIRAAFFSIFVLTIPHDTAMDDDVDELIGPACVVLEDMPNIQSDCLVPVLVSPDPSCYRPDLN